VLGYLANHRLVFHEYSPVPPLCLGRSRLEGQGVGPLLVAESLSGEVLILFDGIAGLAEVGGLLSVLFPVVLTT
jgi:hypothetical protein